MTLNEALMPGTLPDDDKYDEEWKVVLNTGGEYVLSKNQAKILQQAISTGNRGIIMFQTFAISIPYIAEFYRVKRFLRGEKQLPERASEPLYKPIPPEKWEKVKKQFYEKIGKPFVKDKNEVTNF